MKPYGNEHQNAIDEVHNPRFYGGRNPYGGISHASTSKDNFLGGFKKTRRNNDKRNLLREINSMELK